VGAPRAYCVQQHLASHLHYDFRLEHRGVLLSWAVPKGPSLDPSQRRLAMQVEDHPYDYRTFEGVIPSGYGAGVVVLWDEGLWQPLVADVDAALKQGELKFLIAGSKLAGSWVLVRTSRGGDQRTWLLIKHRDQYATTRPIIESKPGSVHDGAGFAEILARTDPQQWPAQRTGAGEAAHLLEEARGQATRLRGKLTKAGRKPTGAVWDAAKTAAPGGASSPPRRSARPSRSRSATAAGATAAASKRRGRAAPATARSRLR
jgi:DNA ligase D-like protein (predicted 3'-phosphoesterase)